MQSKPPISQAYFSAIKILAGEIERGFLQKKKRANSRKINGIVTFLQISICQDSDVCFITDNPLSHHNLNAFYCYLDGRKQACSYGENGFQYGLESKFLAFIRHFRQ